MIAWVATRGSEVEGVCTETVLAVFSTQEKAVAFVQSKPDQRNVWYVVDDFEIDAETPFTSSAAEKKP